MNAARLPKMLALGRSDHDQLIAQIQYLTIENQILRSKLPKRVTLTPKERRRLIRFGKDVGDELRHLISLVQFSTFQKWLRVHPSTRSRRNARVDLEHRERFASSCSICRSRRAGDIPGYWASSASSESCWFHGPLSATSSRSTGLNHRRIARNPPGTSS